MSLTWNQVRTWRLDRQLLTAPSNTQPSGHRDVRFVVGRLCGVQAQVLSAAELAVAVRQLKPEPGQVGRALAERRLVRLWAMRGALHLLDPDDAPAFLALLAAIRSWEKPAWQRTFLTAARLDALTAAAVDALDGRVLTRNELIAEVVAATGDVGLSEALASGWGAVLKPLAWQGLLCHGPSDGARVTFTRPDTWLPSWRKLDAVEAARTAIPAYLSVFGPASAATFDAWLSRGAAPAATLRSWFAAADDTLSPVDVEGQRLYARTQDVEELAATQPQTVVRLLPAFDQYVLGPGTGDSHTVPAGRRGDVSRAAGWIAPTVVTTGGVTGTWQLAEDRLEVTLFAETPPISYALLEAEADRLAGRLGTALTLSVTVNAPGGPGRGE